MDFDPSESSASTRLWELWCGLSKHPNILDAVEHGVLRYAALDWEHPPQQLDENSVAAVATWGVELVRSYEFLMYSVAKHELGWFATPIVKLDLEGEVRLAFVSAKDNVQLMNELPPDLRDRWPHCDEVGLVYVVGRALQGLITTDEPPTLAVRDVIRNCVHVRTTLRFSTLQAVREALVVAGGKRKPALGLRAARRMWDTLEEALGLLALGQPERALQRLEGLSSERARECRAKARASLARGAPKRLDWNVAAVVGRRLEEQRDFSNALQVYSTARAEIRTVDHETAIARCCFQVGRFAQAIEHAARAPESFEAQAGRGVALLRLRRFPDALAQAEAWCAVARAEGRAHYARGKVLLALSRFHEARDAFDRAIQLEPRRVEAMLLRREADRSVKGVCASVGSAAEMRLDIPERFGDVRDLLIHDRIADAIAVLQRVDRAGDAEVSKLLAQLLSFDGRFEDALEVFVRLGDVLGTARTLFALGRVQEALGAFDEIVDDHPDFADALEGRARALRQLGRTAEADEAFARYVGSGAT